jgi:hypothetical protein
METLGMKINELKLEGESEMEMLGSWKLRV